MNAVPFAEVRETNTATVLLIGELAYKIKKPVDLGFLDFSTLEARHAACEAELRLNRRMSPDVYLDVASLTGSDGAVRDAVLIMRRMPEERRLSTLIRSRVDVTDDVRAVARLLAALHAGADRGEHIADVAFGQLRQRWENNLRETLRFRGAPLPDGLHERITGLALDYLAGREALFDDRRTRGLAVDGHADLIADDVFCLPDGPRVLDCLEFDDRLRFVDALDDACFLAMDLEHLGRADLADHFLRCYEEFAATPSVRSLEHHYIAYRAFVRAKVSCIRHAQGDQAIGHDAAAFARQAERHLAAGEVRLVLVGGGPASGKSTLATRLADSMGAVLLRTDVIRREVPGLAHSPDRYGSRARGAVYDELLVRAREALEHGETVIADATWGDAAIRSEAHQLAKDTCSRLVELECRVPLTVAVGRAARRAQVGTDVSEAGPDVARQLSRRAPWPSALTVDGTADLAVVTEQAMRAIG